MRIKIIAVFMSDHLYPSKILEILLYLHFILEHLPTY
jgi:hypothetical protein